jgi:chromosome partitioning protein
MALKRILITNAKGGCGKTTITTNIASHYAQQGLNVRLFDHDNQGSSIAWNNRRPDSLNRIHVVDASKNVDHRMTRSWQLRVPLDTDIAVIDSPAGIEVSELTTLFQQNDAVIQLHILLKNC